MIQKVLIAEDHESANISVQKTLEALQIFQPDYVYHCDDAALKIKKALQAGDPYDLLITDLYFEKDHRTPTLPGGHELIAAVKAEQPALKILVFSAESRPAIIQKLFDTPGIDAFVRKSRGDAQELLNAIHAIYNNQRYYPRNLPEPMERRNAHDFTPFDITILTLMIQGKKVQDIPEYLKQKGIKPSGKSSVEKRLNTIKEAYQFTTNEQLIAYCVKKGIIE